MATKVWTTGRKLAGNLLPLVVFVPIAGFGAFQFFRGEGDFLSRPGLWWMVGGALAGWVAVNLFGLFGNGAMRATLEKRSTMPPHQRTFVGFASPSFRDALDAHEDVGFLEFHDDKLVFRGDSKLVELPRSAIKGATVRPNIHSWLLLGGWVSIEGEIEGKPIRLLVEPRERATLLGNRRLRKGLQTRVKEWMRRGSNQREAPA